MSTNVTDFPSARPSPLINDIHPRVDPTLSKAANAHASPSIRATAIVYCEGNFGAIDGKTANGLVRHSEKYEILSVIDRAKAGLDAGEVLDDTPNGIPICKSLDEAIALADRVPDFLIFGMAPSTGMLSPAERLLMLEAMSRGMGLVNGLHEFLNDDPEFAAASALHEVTILDVRRPRDKKDLRMWSGGISDVTCPRIAILGNQSYKPDRHIACRHESIVFPLEWGPDD